MYVEGSLTAESVPEATQLLDSIDRWQIAREFSVDRVHDCTRVDLYRVFERTTRWSFASVMQAMSRCAHRELPSDVLPVINMQNFDADAGGGSLTVDGRSSIEPLLHTMRWLKETVVRVCPYVGPSLEKRRIWLAAAEREQSVGQGLQDYLLKAHRTLERINAGSDPSDRRLNSLIVTFPDFPPSH